MICKCEAIVSEKDNAIVFEDALDHTLDNTHASRIDDRINEWGRKWHQKEITYRLNSFTKDIKSQYHQKRAVTAALMAWQLRIKDLKFRQERNPDAGVDFDVSFQPLEVFDGKKGVFAHAYYPAQGKISGNCEINDDWHWVTHSKLQTLAKPPLVPVLIHEFGHSLGLVHDSFEMNSIMYPSFDLGKKKNTLHRRDIARIQDLYGARSISQRIIDLFIRRRNMGVDFY